MWQIRYLVDFLHPARSVFFLLRQFLRIHTVLPLCHSLSSPLPRSVILRKWWRDVFPPLSYVSPLSKLHPVLCTSQTYWRWQAGYHGYKWEASSAACVDFRFLVPSVLLSNKLNDTWEIWAESGDTMRHYPREKSLWICACVREFRPKAKASFTTVLQHHNLWNTEFVVS